MTCLLFFKVIVVEPNSVPVFAINVGVLVRNDCMIELFPLQLSPTKAI